MNFSHWQNGIYRVSVSLILVLSLMLCAILADSSGEDDSGEISVPRRPRILGPGKVELTYFEGDKLEDLVCHIQGSPTPSVIWLKNGKRDSWDEVETHFDGFEGLAKLEFKKEIGSRKSEGNYSCVAGNFLGRASKTFTIFVIPTPTSTTQRVQR